jgi:hypothetical protein
MVRGGSGVGADRDDDNAGGTDVGRDGGKEDSGSEGDGVGAKGGVDEEKEAVEVVVFAAKAM